MGDPSNCMLVITLCDIAAWY